MGGKRPAALASLPASPAIGQGCGVELSTGDRHAGPGIILQIEWSDAQRTWAPAGRGALCF